MHNTSSLTNALQLRGLSTEKPTVEWVDTTVKPNIKRRIHNGSTYVETDTGKRYVYDETGEKWTEMQGGGSPSPEYELATTEEVLNVVDSIDW